MSKYRDMDQTGAILSPIPGLRVPARRDASKASRYGSPGSAAGMGGGLRLQDALLDADNRAPYQPSTRPVSLTATRIVRGLACFALIGALAVAHVQLRFLINDSRLQHQRMQRAHRELLQNYAVLERNTAQLSDYDRLHAYATQQLGMVEIDTRPVATIGKEVREKYAGDSIVQTHDKSAPQRAVAEAISGLKAVAGPNLLKLVDSGRAVLEANHTP